MAIKEDIHEIMIPLMSKIDELQIFFNNMNTTTNFNAKEIKELEEIS